MAKITGKLSFPIQLELILHMDDSDDYGWEVSEESMQLIDKVLAELEDPLERIYQISKQRQETGFTMNINRPHAPFENSELMAPKVVTPVKH